MRILTRGPIGHALTALASGLFCLALTAPVVAPGRASASDLKIDMTVEQSLTYHGRRAPLELPYHMRGADHAEIEKSIETVKSSQRTRAMGRSPEAACAIAFQSAIIQLQKATKKLGGNAVVDIVSSVKGKESVVADGFRCRAGMWSAYVVLTGKAVKLAEDGDAEPETDGT